MKTVILLLLIGLVAVSADVWWEYKHYTANDCSGDPVFTNKKGSCHKNYPQQGKSLKYGELDQCKENHKIKTTYFNNADCSGAGEPYGKPVAVPKQNDGECQRIVEGGYGTFTCAGFASASMNVFNAFVIVVAIISTI